MRRRPRLWRRWASIPAQTAGAEALASAVSEDNGKIRGRNVKPSGVGAKAAKTAPLPKARPLPPQEGGCRHTASLQQEGVHCC